MGVVDPSEMVPFLLLSTAVSLDARVFTMVFTMMPYVINTMK